MDNIERARRVMTILSGASSTVVVMFPEIIEPAAQHDWRRRLTHQAAPAYRPVTLVIEPVRDATGICDLTLSITVPSEFGLRGRREIDWDEVWSVGGSHDRWSADVDPIDPDHLAAVRALAAVMASGRSGRRSSTAGLNCASAPVWEFLQRAVDAGVALEPCTSLGVHGVEVVEPIEPGLQVVADHDGGITVGPAVALRVPHRGASSTMTFGAPPHGVAVIGVTTLYLAGFASAHPLVLDLISGPPLRIPRRDLDEFTASFLPAIHARVHVRIDEDVHEGQVISPPTPALVVHVAADGTARIDWTVRYRVDDTWREFDPRHEIDQDPLRDIAAELTMWDGIR
ncbi:MAG: hypothetical protein INR66_09740, partial [Gordonia polyisoprenivorans]|nr:hypothetical protein [Gordonia polyisoprenivorans]